jgi:alcohol dehydrogenase YqhD (iron-dependent ADH family)
VKFAQRIFGLKQGSTSDAEFGKAGIDALKAKYKSWGLPTTLKELGLGVECFEKVTEVVVNDPDSFIKDKNIVRNVLERCL